GADAHGGQVGPAQDRGGEQPALRAEIDRAGAAAVTSAIAAHALGNARALGDALGDQPERDQLHRLVRPRAMAVGALVLAAERLLEHRDPRALERARGHRHRQLERLAVIAEIHEALEPGAGTREALLGELAER